MQVAERAEMFHPRLGWCINHSGQPRLNSIGNKGSQQESVSGRHLLRLP